MASTIKKAYSNDLPRFSLLRIENLTSMALVG